MPSQITVNKYTNQPHAFYSSLLNCGLKSDFFISVHAHHSTAYAAYYKYYAPYNKKCNPHICIQHNAYRNIENCIERTKHKAVQQAFFPREARRKESGSKNGNAAVKTNIYFALTLGKAIAIHAKQNSE